MSGPLEWRSYRDPASYRASDYEQPHDGRLDFEVVREDAWEARVTIVDYRDEHVFEDDYVDPVCFLGFFASSADAKAACQRYLDADERGRSRIRRTLAKALAARVASIERVENLDRQRKIEKLGRTEGRLPEEAESYRQQAKRERAKLWRAGA